MQRRDRSHWLTRRRLLIGALTLGCILLGGISVRTVHSQPSEYVVISWNDLGMHCSNKNFNTLAVLPPFNTLHAQVIRRGEEPSLVTDGVTLSYEVPGNTFSVGKTDFWDYAEALFGQALPPNIGLTGNGLTGQMLLAPNTGYFEASGIPMTPYTDFDMANEDPYQLAKVQVKDGSGNVLAETHPVIPVSNELSCTTSGCHVSEPAIVSGHPAVQGFDTTKPILCASCHQSNALGTTGIPAAKSLSERIHSKHANITNDCYNCHPGPKTRCLRDVMSTQDGMDCQDCHGNVANVAASIAKGRRPWLDEPDCGTCHGAQYAVNPGKLFRTSTGHSGLYCSACHGSPHAIYPSREARDNEQIIALQGKAGTLQCVVCHGMTPSGNEGPHKGGGNGAEAGSLKSASVGDRVIHLAGYDGNVAAATGSGLSVVTSTGASLPLATVAAVTGGAATSTGGGNAAVCAQCHSDGRSGATPPGHISISSASSAPASSANSSAPTSSSSATSNSATSSPAPSSTASTPSRSTAATSSPTSSGAATGASAGGSGRINCGKCHTDGRSGALPPGHIAIAGSSGGTAKAGGNAKSASPAGAGATGRKAGGASNAAVCAQCHSDGRSGKTPPGHVPISGIGGSGKAKPKHKRGGGGGGGGGINCAQCHSDGRSGALPPGHPNVGGGGGGGGGRRHHRGGGGGGEREGGDD